MKLLLVLSEEDKPYLSRLSSLISGHKASVYTGKVETMGQLDILAKKSKSQAIVTNRKDIISLDTKGASVANFMGTILDTPLGHELLVIPALKYLVRVSYGEWLISRYLSKLLEPTKWYPQSQFKYTVLEDAGHKQDFYNKMSGADMCAVDIETVPPNIIRSISYTLKLPDGSTDTGVFLVKSMEDVQWMREFNAHPVPKVCQNGKYECAHFFAWDAPMTNYMCDTLNAMHCTWSELPKDLNFVASVFLRKYRYWKDMREVEGDTATLLKYNALDTWSTCDAFAAWLIEAPQYALTNYVHKWPQVILSHLMEMRGLKRDITRKARWHNIYTSKIGSKLSSIQTMVGRPDFNPLSPKQVGLLTHALTGKAWPSSNEPTLLKIAQLHPVNSRVLTSILDYRGLIKLSNTYLGDKDFNGRWLYTINPHGTETGRDSSKAHHFWCGQNVQNVPAEHWQIKNTVVADSGYELWEADFSQAEARGVAYCSGDEALLKAVNGPHDFHSLNASAFFGIPYDQIYDDITGRKLDKPLRDLAKRVNHGANYNMTCVALMLTMGDEKLLEAKRLLKLPTQWSLKRVAEHLLTQYELTYPRVKTAYYKWIVNQVKAHGMLTGATCWTRYCFGEPWNNHTALNEYIAHITQSLNAMILDKAALKIFQYTLDNNLLNTIKLNAKIHDSILFQTPIGRKDLAEKVAELMVTPVDITDCGGITRTMTVPVDLKHCGKRWEMFQ